MSKAWVTGFTIIALIALLLPAATLTTPKSKQKMNHVTPQAVHPVQEQSFKQAALERDIKATSQLMTDETKKDLKQLLQSIHGHSNLNQVIDSLMKEHPYLVYISVTQPQSSLAKGKLPPTRSGLADQLLLEASSKIKMNEMYISDSFHCDKGSLFRIVAIPDESAAGHGAIAVMKKDVLKSVEAHQKRNLRLIPYPAEGNYRIESVLPNTTKDVTVKNGEDNQNASHYHIKDAVVHFHRELNDKELAQIEKEVQAKVIQQLQDSYIFRSTHVEAKELIQYFKANWKPEFAEPHYLYLTNETNETNEALGSKQSPVIPNDVLYSKYQWNLPSIETEKGWNISKGTDDVIIAVLDTGVQTNHPDLAGRFVDGTNIVDPSKMPEDDVGHGTHVAGIIGATVNNTEGVAGVSWFNKIMPVKVLDSSGAGSTYSVAQGIIWAVDHGAKVINMSLGNYANAEFLHDAVKYAYERDVVLVAASGNDNTDRPGYPAAYPEVFAVAATNSGKQRASFSNYGDYIDVAAPGESIASTYPGNQYAALSGTSMSTPHVAALAGLIRSVRPELTNEEVMNIMRNCTVDLGDPGKDIYFGYGEVDVDKALQAASNYTGTLQMFPSQVKKRLERIANQAS